MRGGDGHLSDPEQGLFCRCRSQFRRVGRRIGEGQIRHRLGGTTIRLPAPTLLAGTGSREPPTPVEDLLQIAGFALPLMGGEVSQKFFAIL